MIDDEELRKRYSPDGSVLRNYQLEMIDTLVLLDKICKENGLTYFLSAGTALGAVRHQGFIPWDDDADIALPKKDYRKLVSILRNYPSDVYALQDRHSDFNYVNAFPKFRRKKGTGGGSFPKRGLLYKYKGTGVDIFCLTKNSYIRAFVCQKIRVALLHWLYLIKNETVRKILTRINWAVFYCIVPLTWPLNIFRKEGELHYALGQGFAKHFMREQEVFPVGEALFESITLPIPHNADAYLTHIYGNWRQVPNEEQILEGIHSKDLLIGK